MRTNRFDDDIMYAQILHDIILQHDNIIYHNIIICNERRETRGTICRLAHQLSIFYIIILLLPRADVPLYRHIIRT